MINQDYDYLGYTCKNCIHFLEERRNAFSSSQDYGQCSLSKVIKPIREGQFQIECPLKEINPEYRDREGERYGNVSN